VLFLILVSLPLLGSKCTPKNICEPIQTWNLEIGKLLPDVWNIWQAFVLRQNEQIFMDLINEYKEELDPERIDELVASLKGEEDPTDPVVKEIYDKYMAEMSMYDEASKKLEKILDTTASSAETIEHATIACQDFSSSAILDGVIETAQGLADIIDILASNGVPVPDWLVAASEQADKIKRSVQ